MIAGTYRGTHSWSACNCEGTCNCTVVYMQWEASSFDGDGNYKPHRPETMLDRVWRAFKEFLALIRIPTVELWPSQERRRWLELQPCERPAQHLPSLVSVLPIPPPARLFLLFCPFSPSEE